VGANHLYLKLFLALVGTAEINAYLMYADSEKLTSAEFSHGDFKEDLGTWLTGNVQWQWGLGRVRKRSTLQGVQSVHVRM
jgi:hypothetical protein